MSWMRVNPVPMGTATALGSSTPAMQQTAAKAYGRKGGRKSASKRRGMRNGKKKTTARRNGNGRKLKFGKPAWRKKYMGKKRK